MGWSELRLGNSHLRGRVVRVRVQVDGLDDIALPGTVADQVAEVLQGDLALAADLQGLVAPGAELFDGASEFHPEVVGRESQDLAHFAGDTGAVEVDVVNGGQLGGDLGGDPVRQRLRDLLEDVGSSAENCEDY